MLQDFFAPCIMKSMDKQQLLLDRYIKALDKRDRILHSIDDKYARACEEAAAAQNALAAVVGRAAAVEAYKKWEADRG